jgi:ABC-type phosphate/phosphonate transport system substrate-binding protein
MQRHRIASARMYSVAPGAATAWRMLFAWLRDATGVPLEVIEHAYPQPIADLWNRTDLLCTFICGLPFARSGSRRLLVAAPVPRSEGAAVYRSHFVVRADSRFATLEDSFGARLGWTVSDSHSGYSAPRHHLLRYRSRSRPRLYAASVGGLVTPRRVIEAVRDGIVDIGPVDGFAWDLLARHAPLLTGTVRVLASTEPVPVPPLVASEGAPRALVDRLGAALLRVGEFAHLEGLRDALCIEGFARPDPAAYEKLVAWAREAESAGYAALG